MASLIHCCLTAHRYLRIYFSSKRYASFSVELDDDDLLTAADNMLDLSSRMYWTSLFPIPTLHGRKVIKRAVHVPPYSSVQSNPTKTQSTLTFTPHSQTKNNVLPEIHHLLRRCRRFGCWRLRLFHRGTPGRPVLRKPHPVLLPSAPSVHQFAFRPSKWTP